MVFKRSRILRTHGVERVRETSRLTGLVQAVMRNRRLPGVVVPR